MNRFFTIILIILIYLDTSGQSKKEFRELSKYFTGMQTIQKDEYYPRINSAYLEASEYDSLLILTYLPTRVNVNGFMISDHEVTNLEYRQFVNWVKDSIFSQQSTQENKEKELKYSYRNHKGETLNVQILPDTSTWITDFVYSYNEPYQSYYFRHKAYDDYPVVGVSYVQANAYTYWLNSRLQLFLKEHNFKPGICNYRLPTEVEWQYAAMGKPKRLTESNQNVYPWGGNLFNSETRFEANFGQIIDKNNVYIKNYGQDGFLITSPVKSYEANYFNLYDMAGNVSEWVSDTINIEEFENKIAALFRTRIPKVIAVTRQKVSDRPLMYKKLTTKKIDSISANIVIDELLTFSPDWEKVEEVITDPYILDQLKSIYYKAERDMASIKKMKYPGIVKGGSWDSSPVYMMSCVKQLFPQLRSSSKIGFRICLDIDKDFFELLVNYYAQQNVKNIARRCWI